MITSLPAQRTQLGAVMTRPAPRPADATAEVSALRRERKAAGLCPRCGSALEQRPEINALTGKQLKRDGAPVTISICADECGYKVRPYANRRT